MRRQRLIEVGGGAHLLTERWGTESAETVLLIGAATWSMDWWRDGWCAELVERGFGVLRYDQRDTGASTTYPRGEPGYTGADLVADAVGVLDAYAIGRAHVIGISMGGGLAQQLALQHRDRLATLTLISTTPADGVAWDLPDPSPELMSSDGPAEPDWTDPAAVVGYLVETERPYAGPGHFDESDLRALVTRVVARTSDPSAASTNHFLVAGDDDAPAADLTTLAGLPTLVVHGSADPLFPPAHGAALAEAIPGARLLVLDDVGHQLPPPTTWSTVIAAVVELSGRRQSGAR